MDFDSLSPFFDQNQFFPHPSSPPFPLSISIFASLSPHPLITSSPERPVSPLWNFSDGDDDQFGGNSSSSIPRGLRLSDSSGFVSRGPESVTGKVIGDTDKKGCIPPTMGLVPMDNPDLPCMIKERMTQALRYFKESTEQSVLAQVWAPIKIGDRYVLTTSGQPFVLDPQSSELLQYRMVSLMYVFYVDGESDGNLGIPGRVFRQKLPEWTPNVQYYTKNEYPQLNHALHYNVRGTLALPVIEPSGQSCIGVLELIMTSQKVNYAPEVDKLCKALEVVNLRSSEILDNPNLQIWNEGRQHVLAEILEILTVVCETHKLPLAQTWAPCRHRNFLANGGGLNTSCSSFDGSCVGQICMSTTDVAFYVVDAHMWGFRDACAEHHLQKGQGVAGRAFSSHSSCFSRDITQFSKTEYPLVHYALMFGLMSCYAICLHSTHTGSDDFVVEFFLPPSIMDDSEQQDLLATLMATMKQHFRSLRVASEENLEEELRSVQSIELSTEEVMQASSRKTLERRQHGILRWPLRKVNKVNRCRSKLKRVTESIEGAEAAFNLTSLATSRLSVASGSISWSFCVDGPKEQQSPGSNSEFQGRKEMQSPTKMTLQSSGILDNPNLQVMVDADNSVMNQDPFPIQVGEIFASAKECRAAIINASILAKKEVKFGKSEKRRIVATCSYESCKWRIYARAEEGNENVIVTTLSDNHTCLRFNASTNKKATSVWVTDHILDMIRDNPNVQPKEIQTFIKSKYGVDIEYMTAYRAKEKASKKIRVGSTSWPVSLDGPKEQSPGSNTEFQGRKEVQSPTQMTLQSNVHGETGNQILERGILLPHQEVIHEQNGPHSKFRKGSNGSKTGSGSADRSTGNPTSHGSCQSCLANETTPSNDLFVPSIQEQALNIGSPLHLVFQQNRELNRTAAYSIPDALISTQQQPQQPLCGRLIEDAGSSKDLSNLCNLGVEGCLDEQVRDSSWIHPPILDQTPQQEMAAPLTMPHVTATQDVRAITIKATYRGDIIRFRFLLTSGLVELKEEVSKSLELEVGTFYIKYLDDDEEWVMLACDADLQECLEISRISGRHMIRLLVHDKIGKFL